MTLHLSNKSFLNQANKFSNNLRPCQSSKLLFFNYRRNGIATCAAIPLRDSSNFEYFTWLPQGQGKCQQYTEGAARFEVWTSIPKVN